MEGRFSLEGVDGNAFAVMGYTRNCMRSCCRDAREAGDMPNTTKFGALAQDTYIKKAMSGSYDELVALSCEVVEECNKYYEEREAS